MRTSGPRRQEKALVARVVFKKKRQRTRMRLPEAVREAQAIGKRAARPLASLNLAPDSERPAESASSFLLHDSSGTPTARCSVEAVAAAPYSGSSSCGVVPRRVGVGDSLSAAQQVRDPDLAGRRSSCDSREFVWNRRSTGDREQQRSIPDPSNPVAHRRPRQGAGTKMCRRICHFSVREAVAQCGSQLRLQPIRQQHREAPYADWRSHSSGEAERIRGTRRMLY